jgi:hypothetical protein
MPIVPVQGAIQSRSSIDWRCPRQCYIEAGATAELYKKLFVYVDFGLPANHFLRACGTKDRPSVEDIALVLLDNPQSFYDKTEKNLEMYALLGIWIRLPFLPLTTLVDSWANFAILPLMIITFLEAP